MFEINFNLDRELVFLRVCRPVSVFLTHDDVENKSSIFHTYIEKVTE